MPKSYIYFVKISLLFLGFLLTCSFAAGQSKSDSITRRYDSLAKAKSAKLDSTGRKFNNKIDSMQMKVNAFANPDFKKIIQFNPRQKRLERLEREQKEREVLRISLKKNIDSLEKNNIPATHFVHRLDSLNKIEEKTLAYRRHELDSAKGSVSHQIDSLKGLNLSTDTYTRKLDSLNAVDPTKFIDQKVGGVTDKINQPLANVEGKMNEKLSLMNQQGGAGANIPGAANLPGVKAGEVPSLKTDLGLPGGDLKGDNPLRNVESPLKGEMAQVDELKGNVNDLKSAPQQQIDKLKSIDEVKGAQDKLGQANALTDKVQAYGDDARNIAKGDLGEVKQIPEAIENKAKNLDEIKELEKHTGEMGKYSDMLGKGNDPEAMKELAKQQAVTYAKDHFAGQQAALQGAMDKMSKLKSKYSEVTSIKDLPKHPPNPMKKKAIIERIVPGVTLQIQKTQNVIIDLNPVASYRLTGRWNAGAGWNERFSFAKWNVLSDRDRIYGPRAFTSFAVFKGFALKLEGEKMNTFIPAFMPVADAGSRVWVWSVFAGIKKDYQFMRKVNGNVQFLYNIYDDRSLSPYVERFNVRMGFEFPMKKRKKPAATAK